MKQALLIRYSGSKQGKRGILVADSKHWHSIELPWNENKQNISCIPIGDYTVTIRISSRYGRVYWITNVEGRSWILFHSGNWAGSTEDGYRTHTKGCVLLGGKRGTLLGQAAVLLSRKAVREFMEVMKGESFKLKVMEV